MFVALATVVLTLVIGAGSAPAAPAGGGARPEIGSPLSRGLWQSWVGFTEIVLALSGVEAIANMTGIMVPPVEKTARKAIVPVLVEIVMLNLILAAAMNALPDSILPDARAGEPAHTGDMLKVIAAYYVGPTFATVSSVVFALLLLSAVNTALADLVSIQFMLSRDKELPHAFGGPEPLRHAGPAAGDRGGRPGGGGPALPRRRAAWPACTPSASSARSRSTWGRPRPTATLPLQRLRAGAHARPDRRS